MTEPLVPESLRELFASRSPQDRSAMDWLRRAPAIVAEHLDAWDLRVDGPVRHGECALVVPVRRGSEPAALKVSWPHPEARHEHLALRHWDGAGAVRLLAADPAAYVLLLERLDADRELTSVPILEACEVIGGLMRRLDRPAGPQYDRLSDKVDRWLPALRAGSPLLPRRLAEQAADTLESLRESDIDGRLVHEDLHDLNVLAPLDPARGDWLAIDPKPVSGEWAYAVAPIVWNRAEATTAAYNPRVHVRLRAEVVAEAAGLDPDRVARWTFVRLVLNGLWAAEHGSAGDDFRARMITLAKAFAN